MRSGIRCSLNGFTTHRCRVLQTSKVFLALGCTHVNWLSLQKTVVMKFIFSKAVTFSQFYIVYMWYRIAYL